MRVNLPPMTQLFDPWDADRLWMDYGWFGPAHAYGSCPTHCPLCKEAK